MIKDNFALFSQGCCGSGYMVKCLKKVGLKRKQSTKVHSRCPSTDVCKRALFMYADPRDILLCSVNQRKDNKFILPHSRFLGGDGEYFNPNDNTTITELLDKKYDPLKLEEHFISWLKTPIDYKLMILKYESLVDPKVFNDVLNFFSIKNNIKYSWKPRKTSFKTLNKRQQYEITRLFNNLLCIQNELPYCYVR